MPAPPPSKSRSALHELCQVRLGVWSSGELQNLLHFCCQGLPPVASSRREEAVVAAWTCLPRRCEVWRLAPVWAQGADGGLSDTRAGSGHRLFLIDRKLLAPVGSQEGAAEEFAVLGATGNGMDGLGVCHEQAAACLQKTHVKCDDYAASGRIACRVARACALLPSLVPCEGGYLTHSCLKHGLYQGLKPHLALVCLQSTLSPSAGSPSAPAPITSRYEALLGSGSGWPHLPDQWPPSL